MTLDDARNLRYGDLLKHEHVQTLLEYRYPWFLGTDSGFVVVKGIPDTCEVVDIRHLTLVPETII